MSDYTLNDNGEIVLVDPEPVGLIFEDPSGDGWVVSTDASKEFAALKDIQREMQKFAQSLISEGGPYVRIGKDMLRIANGERLW